MTRSGPFPALLAILAFLMAGLYVATHIADAIDTDIISLLPGDVRDPVLADALTRASTVASDRVAFAIEGGTPQDRHDAAATLVAELSATGLFKSSSVDAEGLWRWLFAHRTSLLCAADRERLSTGKGTEIAADALRQWYSPMGMGGSDLLRSDPLLLTSRLLGCLMPASIRAMPGEASEIVSGSITASVYRLDVQDRIAAAIEAWRVRPEAKRVSLYRAGAVFHAAYGAEHARAEMSTIGGITTVAVLLLYWLMFYSLRAPVIAIAMVLYSLTIGLALTLVVFGRIHAMGLVFGAALIGMVVDYTTYYLVTAFDDAALTADERKARIWKPLSLGMLTSVGAFAALLFFPVPAFRQIAVFGAAGLAAAWAATLLLTPLAEKGRMKKGPGALAIERSAGRFLSRTPTRWAAWLSLAVCALVAAAGFLRGGVLDDVKRFQAPSAKLMIEEARVKAATGFATSGSFFLVRGDSADAAAIHEEELLARLEREGDGSAIVLAASRLAPSHGREEADAGLVAERLIAPSLPGLLERLGVKPAQVYGPKPEAALPDFIASLRGETGPVHWSIVPLAGNMDGFARVDGPFWQFVDPAARYSELMAKYRRLATAGLGAAVISTGLLLLLAYRRFSALKILLPMTTALVVTPAITGLVGVPFSFFSAMGLFLVVGAGVDYAIFQWEHPLDEGKWTRVGIVLAAIMTCISVGLLGLSSVLPVRSFGVTVAVGILLSVLLSPLVRRWR